MDMMDLDPDLASDPFGDLAHVNSAGLISLLVEDADELQPSVPRADNDLFCAAECSLLARSTLEPMDHIADMQTGPELPSITETQVATVINTSALTSVTAAASPTTATSRSFQPGQAKEQGGSEFANKAKAGQASGAIFLRQHQLSKQPQNDGINASKAPFPVERGTLDFPEGFPGIAVNPGMVAVAGQPASRVDTPQSRREMALRLNMKASEPAGVGLISNTEVFEVLEMTPRLRQGGHQGLHVTARTMVQKSHHAVRTHAFDSTRTISQHRLVKELNPAAPSAVDAAAAASGAVGPEVARKRFTERRLRRGSSRSIYTDFTEDDHDGVNNDVSFASSRSRRAPSSSSPPGFSPTTHLLGAQVVPPGIPSLAGATAPAPILQAPLVATPFVPIPLPLSSSLVANQPAARLAASLPIVPITAMPTTAGTPIQLQVNPAAASAASLAALATIAAPILAPINLPAQMRVSAVPFDRIACLAPGLLPPEAAEAAKAVVVLDLSSSKAPPGP